MLDWQISRRKFIKKYLLPLSVDDDDDGDAGRWVSKPAFKTACSAIDFKDDIGSSFYGGKKKIIPQKNLSFSRRKLLINENNTTKNKYSMIFYFEI